MNEREKILDAWIMEERLSEGDVSPNSFGLGLPNENDFFAYFNPKIQKKVSENRRKKIKDDKIGLVVYFDVFPFEPVVKMLRELFPLLPPSSEERDIGNKFSFALFFNQSLNLVSSLTFFSASYYLKENFDSLKEKGFSSFEKDFSAFEEEEKKEIEALFDYSEKNDEEEETRQQTVPETEGEEKKAFAKNNFATGNSKEVPLEEGAVAIEISGGETVKDVSEKGELVAVNFKEMHSEEGTVAIEISGGETVKDASEKGELVAVNVKEMPSEEDVIEMRILEGDFDEPNSSEEKDPEIKVYEMDLLEETPEGEASRKEFLKREERDVDNEKKIKFNEAFLALCKRYSISVEDLKQGEKYLCRWEVLNNYETEAINLHSFFIEDLKKAKSIHTDKLDAYLSGENSERINLDWKQTPEAFREFLQPSHYPSARFPSNPAYALSLMQQMAVNIAIREDGNQIRSVNGPPGTGKTTLLKDVFAELVVQQAVEIVKTDAKRIYGTENTRYYNNASIGLLPDTLTSKGIVVASSNNGAVQNIVNELPLIVGIDSAFQQELKDADYFRDIANGHSAEEKKWGLFSLEGGSKNNMYWLRKAVQAVKDYLEKEYISNEGVCEEFEKQYNEIRDYKTKRQKIADIFQKKETLSKELAQIKENQRIEQQKEANEYETYVDLVTKKQEEVRTQSEKEEKKIANFLRQIEIRKKDIGKKTQSIELIKLRKKKPFFFSFKKTKENYKADLKQESALLEQINILGQQEVDLTKQEYESELKRDALKEKLSQIEAEISAKRRAHENWLNHAQDKIQRIENELESIELKLKDLSVQKLDFELDYDSFQKSNPWFDEEYRRLQSKLFITALKVRKQFLYNNNKNIKAAINIWYNQGKYLERKDLIRAAWGWINMVVPVISSTFASFSRMCGNMPEGSIGNLFVDEAGQALPQASVGAIFRSERVMVLGDPAQITPVVTLDSSVLGMLGKGFDVDPDAYLFDSVSTQILVDRISRYGFYKKEEEWIGIPLWVHRRCLNPMFDISNAISYGGNMVQSNSKPGKAEWYDVSGQSEQKYVPAQGRFLRDKLIELSKTRPEIMDSSKKDVVYIITPFKNVAKGLIEELDKIDFVRRNENKKVTNIGTVHTFQGKEAPIVFFVLGCGEKETGAANWAVSSPNIMNVAVTRAKEEFYVIANRELYLKRVGGKNIEIMSDVIERFQRA